MLLSCSPVKAGVLFGEVIQRSGNLGEIPYKPSVEVGESKETSHIAHVTWGWPVSDCSYLERIHFHFPFPYDEAKVFDLVLFKFTFFRPEVQVIFL